jgi:hypothetical protein
MDEGAVLTAVRVVASPEGHPLTAQGGGCQFGEQVDQRVIGAIRAAAEHGESTDRVASRVGER